MIIAQGVTVSRFPTWRAPLVKLLSWGISEQVGPLATAGHHGRELDGRVAVSVVEARESAAPWSFRGQASVQRLF